MCNKGEKTLIAIDKRLKTIAGFVTQGGYTVDVGTDHGYLAIYLVESGRSQKALATDVREMPLQSAKQNIAEHLLSGKISTMLTDGLNGVDLEDVTDIVIAGMGGILISEILEARHPLDGKNLVLQPMTQAGYLRQWLCQNGYDILEEAPAFAGDKAYCIIHVQYDGVVRNSDELFRLVGKIPQSKGEDVERYLAHIEQKLLKKAAGLQKSGKEPEELCKTLDLVDKVRGKR